MASTNVADRLAVCSWSLEPGSPEELIEKMRQIGINKMQLRLDLLATDPAWAEAGQKLKDAGMELIGGMFPAVGEDYSSLESIARTGGVVPDETWPKTWEIVQQIAPIAGQLGLDYVMFHAGFLPHEESAPNFKKLLGRVQQVADAFGEVGAKVGLETGQEDAPTLLQFFQHVGRPNVTINFDPANMILYDKGDPVESLRVLSKHLGQVHIKDANRTARPGTWGEEVVVGTGEVEWPAFFEALDEAEFDSYLVIEREAGDDRVGDIRMAKEHVLSIVQ